MCAAYNKLLKYLLHLASWLGLDSIQKNYMI